MATKLYDLCEANLGGYWSGWADQRSTGATIVADPTVLISGLLTTKHTIVDSLSSVDRADLAYDRSGISPAGPSPFSKGASVWFRTAVKLDANYVPQLLGGNNDGLFNILIDIHGNTGVYTPWEIAINANNSKWRVHIQGGGSSLTAPTSNRGYDISVLNPGDVLDVSCFVTWNADSTGRTIVYASVNGTPLNSGNAVVDDTGPIGSTVETGFYAKNAHYRGGNKGGGTTSVYHTGWIIGDSKADLVVPTKGTIKIGYLDGSLNPIVGATVNANGVGSRGCRVETMVEDGTITHLADYIDYTGSGNIQAIMVLYDGATGAKLGQTRVFGPNAATDPSGFKELQLTQAVSRRSGQTHRTVTHFELNAALTRWRGDNVGTNTFFSDSNGWTAPNGPEDPLGANATGNPNRTKSGYALYAVPRADVQAPTSSCAGAPLLVTSPSITLPYSATDDTMLDKVQLYVKVPEAVSYTLALTDDNATGTSYSGSFTYTPDVPGIYSFYTVAVDAAGNVEPVPDGPDILVTYANPGVAGSPTVSSGDRRLHRRYRRRHY